MPFGTGRTASLPCAMIILTIVRHGESTDNTKALWAGWADAPLSKHGHNQAVALGKSLSPYRVDAIFASDLLRATWTAQQIQAHQDPQPPLTRSDLLREQNFGKAERQPYGTSQWSRGPGRNFKFEGGESQNDVRARAEVATALFIEPILRRSRGIPVSEAPHVFIVAHGIFNGEYLGSLLARRPPQVGQGEWRSGGMTNTGWNRCEIGYADELAGHGGQGQTQASPEPIDVDGEDGSNTAPTAGPGAPVDLESTTTSAGGHELPHLFVRIIATNVTSHLESVKKQRGGIGSSAYDENQKDIRSFFGGGAVSVDDE